MNSLKIRVLDKEGNWRYGVYPCLGVDMSGVILPMNHFWDMVESPQGHIRRETLGLYVGRSNEKEIYENDLVKRVSEYPQNIGRVMLSFHGWRIEFIQGNHPLYIPDNYSKEKYTTLFNDSEHYPRGLEKVGNVYQNPELWERK